MKKNYDMHGGDSMKIANLLFVYKRSEHTARVLEALSRNTILPQKLIIFQDGLRDDKDICEWNKVNRLINSIDWCDHEVLCQHIIRDWPMR